VPLNRRTFLELLAAAVAVTPVFADIQGATPMYGLIAKLTILPGKRDDMIRILREGTAAMPGCFSYVLAKDSTDENILWVTEVWNSEASHDASLSLPAVKDAIAQGRPLVSAFEKIAVTTPVSGVGLPSEKTA
jgi:quinol monooxygenase YgiN